MAITSGLNHLGLAVKDLRQTTKFFTEYLNWEESGFDSSYPRTSVTDGKVRLTLWQTDQQPDLNEFDRRTNVGLHHIAFEVESEQILNETYNLLKDRVRIEFSPELVGSGPRKHMMCYEPGGIRVEFIWQGQ
ncbi:glyoxalase [Chromatiales bacterium (ex Bugula neritina AB1)]|nr:glyoxalase [Chromatiales bacterium (ex Bugula neritina AB1)]